MGDKEEWQQFLIEKIPAKGTVSNEEIPKSIKRGKFIVIEGIDGCGTSTQITMLKNKFDGNLIPNHATKEPTDGPAGVIIRMALRKRISLDPKTFTMFFATDRYDHLHTKIIPLLEKGINVICDRYYLSNYAYQSIEEEVDLDWIIQLNSKCLKPDLNIIIDIPANEALKRKNRLYDYKLEFYEKQKTLERVRMNFRRLGEKLKKEGGNIEIIDGTLSKTTVSNKIWELVKTLMVT